MSKQRYLALRRSESLDFDKAGQPGSAAVLAVDDVFEVERFEWRQPVG